MIFAPKCKKNDNAGFGLSASRITIRQCEPMLEARGIILENTMIIIENSVYYNPALFTYAPEGIRI